MEEYIMKLKTMSLALIFGLTLTYYGNALADPITDGGGWTCAGEGCPDNDDDGIPNIDDDCPYEAGAEGARGCVGWTNSDVDWSTRFEDNDYDRIINLYDKCPEIPDYGRSYDEGFGCPLITDGGDWECVGCDIDGDGVDDTDDDCRDTPEGVEVDADGCAIETDEDVVDEDEDTDEEVEFYTSEDKNTDETANEPPFNLPINVDGNSDLEGNFDKNNEIESFNGESCSLVENGQAINVISYILFALTLVPLMIRRKKK